MFTNNTNLPLSLAVMLAHDEYPEHRDGVISVTSLLKPIKPLILGLRLAKSKKDQVIDISTRVASSYGTAIHNALEAAWCSDNLSDTLKSLGYPPGLVNNIKVNPKPDELDDCIPIYTEFRNEKEIMGWIVSGEFDFVAEGRVRDLKTTSTYGYVNSTKDEDYILQGSMYRWLNPDKITDDVMAIDFVFTDWNKLSSITQKDKYPPSRMLEKLYELKPIAETEQFIKDKLTLVNTYIDADEEDIPRCTDEDLWVAPSKWKYFKNPSAARATRVYENQAEAMAHFTKDGSIGIVKEIKGEIKACRYCDAAATCKQAAEYVSSGQLTL